MSYKKLVYLLIFLFPALAILFLPGRLIKIENIDCVSQYGPCPEELDLILEKFVGGSLARVRAGAKKNLSQDLFVRDYSVQYKLPGTLRIDIILRKGKFALNKIGTSDFAVVDKDGTTLEIKNSTNLPTVRISDDFPKPGQQINERLLFASNITYDMYAFYQVRGAKINNDSLVVDITKEPTVIFPLEGDKDALLGGLKLIMSRLNKIVQDPKIEGVTEIDLRFKNPVVR